MSSVDDTIDGYHAAVDSCVISITGCQNGRNGYPKDKWGGRDVGTEWEGTNSTTTGSKSRSLW